MAGPTELIRQNCPIATTANDGLMSKEQVAQLDGGATVTPPSFADLSLVSPASYAGQIAFDELTERLAISFGGAWLYVAMEAP
jgi:hypothetical protein